jgi:DNA-binding HxlR family transcriptional regulator
MEMNQLVNRIVHPTTPVNVEYRITAHGETFAPVAKTMILWSIQHPCAMDGKIFIYLRAGWPKALWAPHLPHAI